MNIAQQVKHMFEHEGSEAAVKFAIANETSYERVGVGVEGYARYVATFVDGSTLTIDINDTFYPDYTASE